MNDILSGITEILDDPAAAAKIGEIAKSISGGGDKPSEPVLPTADAGPVLSSDVPGLGSFAAADRHITLLRAIQPYLRNERAEKVSTAIKAISVLKALSGLK